MQQIRDLLSGSIPLIKLLFAGYLVFQGVELVRQGKEGAAYTAIGVAVAIATSSGPSDKEGSNGNTPDIRVLQDLIYQLEARNQSLIESNQKLLLSASQYQELSMTEGQLSVLQHEQANFMERQHNLQRTVDNLEEEKRSLSRTLTNAGDRIHQLESALASQDIQHSKELKIQRLELLEGELRPEVVKKLRDENLALTKQVNSLASDCSSLQRHLKLFRDREYHSRENEIKAIKVEHEENLKLIVSEMQKALHAFQQIQNSQQKSTNQLPLNVIDISPEEDANDSLEK